MRNHSCDRRLLNGKTRYHSHSFLSHVAVVYNVVHTNLFILFILVLSIVLGFENLHICGTVNEILS